MPNYPDLYHDQPWNIFPISQCSRDIQCISLGYPELCMFIPSISLHLLFFTKMSSTGWLARVPHIRRRPSSTSNTNHGVGEPFIQLNFLDALAGCTGDLPMSIFAALSLTCPDGGLKFMWIIRVTSKNALTWAEIKVSTSDQMQQDRVPWSRVESFSTVLAALSRFWWCVPKFCWWWVQIHVLKCFKTF